ncbi:MAG: 3-dehydroquinate synthase [Bacteroidetes bacterium]|nr:3-dehydroquinate synthase [Bacteroidota bacterium]MBS1758227.1 3-dehydroquinate synthase [Bacteroidota bacterium]
MKRETFVFSQKKVDYLFDASFNEIENFFPKEKIIIITDDNLFKHHATRFEAYKVITIPHGEAHKQQATIDNIVQQLLAFEADKQSCIVGVGGGVVTDMAGYAASIFKRGTKLALAPTSILAMVDAAIGGKNGIDVGPYKNMVGTVHQPDVLLFDYSFLSTLPTEEWVNGFAEIVKHACIKDADLFDLLQQNTIEKFMADKAAIAALVERNVAIKTSVVLQDEFETGDRKLLNFGHTIGHAIENIYHLPHGHAVSIGMVAACNISEEINNFYSVDKEKIVKLLEQYRLPVKINIDTDKIWELLLMDKKRNAGNMNFILLNKIGDATIVPIGLIQLKQLVKESL